MARVGEPLPKHLEVIKTACVVTLPGGKSETTPVTRRKQAQTAGQLRVKREHGTHHGICLLKFYSFFGQIRRGLASEALQLSNW